jgi:hypothetical protein
MAKKKIRPLGKITSDLEPLWFEMLVDHDMQRHEVVGLFLQWAQTHTLGLEHYKDGTVPVLYYGHKDGLSSKEKK